LKGSSLNRVVKSELATSHPEPFFLKPIKGEKTMIEQNTTEIELEVEEMEQMDAPGIMLGD
jgi:hypothetical protein